MSMENNEDLKAEYARMVADLTVSMEVSRCDSLRKMSDAMLAGASILSVALLTVAGPLFAFFSADAGLRCSLVGFYVLVSLSLISTMILVVLSMTRFGYTAPASPDALLKNICAFEKPLSDMDMARSYVELQETLYQGFKARNDRIRSLLIASQATLIIALASSVVGGVILLVGGLPLLV